MLKQQRDSHIWDRMTNNMPNQKPAQSAISRIPLTIAAVVIGGAIGFAALHGVGSLRQGPSGDPACRAAVATAQRIAPLAHGEVAALAMATAPLRLPDLAFEDAEGKPRNLSDFRGKTVLVNLWATWCVPCRKEMPSLDALQAKLGGPDFEVVAINTDTRDPEKPKNFLKEINVTRLGYFSDPKGKSIPDLRAIGRAPGLPTSVLVDPQGCEIAFIAGPAEWASDDALNLIRAAMSPKAAAL